MDRYKNKRPHQRLLLFGVMCLSLVAGCRNQQLRQDPWLAKKQTPPTARRVTSPAARQTTQKAAPTKKKPAVRPVVAHKTPTQVNAPFSHALLLNGGAEPHNNYYSHVLYLRMMRETLRTLGLKESSISIFASDGDKPDSDQSISSGSKDIGYMLFYRRPEQRFFSPKVKLVNTTLKQKTLYAAKYSSLKRFTRYLHKQTKTDKRPLLLFVTDHGTRNRKDTSGRNQYISLWQEEMSVREYHKMLSPLHRRRVVSVMSQCFSGSFAWAIYEKPGVLGVPTGDHCGFYATTPFRPAYGCFPDTKLSNSVGHAYRFIKAMKQVNTMDEAHRLVMLRDLTPDVPLRSSDVYLASLLRWQARRLGERFLPWVDKLIKTYEDRPYPGMSDDLAMLSALAHRFGLSRPVDLLAIRSLGRQLSKRSKWWERVENMWSDVFVAARDHQLKRWYRRRPQVRRRLMFLRAKALSSLHQPGEVRPCIPMSPASGSCERRPLCVPSQGSLSRSAAFLRDGFRNYLKKSGHIQRLTQLYKTKENMHRHVFWIEVQRAVLLRMRYMFLRIAGRLLLHHAKSNLLKRHQGGLKRLLACEQTRVRVRSGAVASLPRKRIVPSNFPILFWFGISFETLKPDASSGLPYGTVMVQNVYLRTPAAKAGIRVGDVIYAVNGRALQEPYEIRERVMLQDHTKPLKLSVIRARRKIKLSVMLRQQSVPPALKLPSVMGNRIQRFSALRFLTTEGKTFAKQTTPHKATLLFFWATWCGPCKMALPFLRRLKRTFADLKIVTVSGERPKTIRRWIQAHPGALPFLNAADPKSAFSRRLRIRATPTFVLLSRGKVVQYHIGANPAGMMKLLSGIQKQLP